VTQTLRTTKSRYSELLDSAGLTPEDFESLLVSSPALWLETLTELEAKPTVLEPYQIRFLQDQSYYRLVNKARQIGFSTVIAAEGLYKAATTPSYKANYISINQKEAKDKLDIARSLYHSIPDHLQDSGWKPQLWNDSEETLGFHAPPNTSLLISQPASAAVRGGKKDIYFDEAAHIRDFKKLYQAALPAIIRGEGRITVVSTPMDESGLFYDLATDTASFREYSRHVVPWWEAATMVKPGFIAEAIAEAPVMTTWDRVHKYGSDKLLTVFGSAGDDMMAFQTEFECTFVDELEAYYPWDLIVGQSDEQLELFKGEIPRSWQPTGQLSLGVDLAKERDQSVFILVESIEQEDEVHRYVRWLKATQEPYKDQWEYLDRVIKMVRPSRISIDKTGVGNMLVEQLNHHSGIEGVIFNQAKKEGWATKFKGDLQTGRVHYPAHSELMKQIHGIRRTKTENGLYKFSGKKDDYFWALMLALYGEGRGPVRFSLL
jgi:phage FluMu gp28-like protein